MCFMTSVEPIILIEEYFQAFPEERKKRLAEYDPETHLSELDVARTTSKTWSMEQE